jgi:hypothetical protein
MPQPLTLNFTIRLMFSRETGMQKSIKVDWHSQIYRGQIDLHHKKKTRRGKNALHTLYPSTPAAASPSRSINLDAKPSSFSGMEKST